jgi:beta-carotene 15,15'-monooxygenase
VGKFNVKTKEAQIWEESSSCLAGSPIFIPNPLGDTHDEDNGVLISAITSTNENKPSFLLILDAKTFKEMARIEFDSQIPCHMHAHFINN